MGMDILRLYFKILGCFFDIVLFGVWIDRVLNFVGDVCVLLFEYVFLDGLIVCDGEYS